MQQFRLFSDPSPQIRVGLACQNGGAAEPGLPVSGSLAFIQLRCSRRAALQRNGRIKSLAGRMETPYHWLRHTFRPLVLCPFGLERIGHQATLRLDSQDISRQIPWALGFTRVGELISNCELICLI